MSLLLMLLLAGEIGDALTAESGRRMTTASVEVTSTFARMGAGGSRGVPRSINFPIGCDYISHDVQLVKREPRAANEGPSANPHHYFRDRLERDRSGRVKRLELLVQAVRPFTLGPGGATSTIRVTVTASCDKRALPEFQGQFD